MLLSTCSFVALVVGAAATVQETYDYIIVGGGTAGSALAARLSAGLPNNKILLIEAGPAAPDELRINVPGLRGSILGSSYDWNFSSVAQPSLNGRKIDVNRGKVLGGSSAMNYLCYDRASSPEYDAWEALGSDGWNWKTMIAAMTKSENFTGNDGDVHGRSGPIRTTYNRIIPKVLETWKPAAKKLGIPISDGKSLGGSPIGASYQPTNIDTTNWSRSYSAKTYLRTRPSNLVLKTDTYVSRVVFATSSSKSLVATGVALADGTIIKARKEVILSAGSIQSPGLLEYSGIGQAEVLKKAGIKQILELPGVGENYQDHLRVSNTYRLKPGYESFDPLIYDNQGAFATEELNRWLRNEVSWYDMTTTAYGFLNWKQLGESVQERLTSLAKAAAKTVVDKKKLEYLKNAVIPQLELILEANYVGAAGYTGGKFITIFSSVMHPLSRGSVHISTNNNTPSNKPLINLNYFNNEYDINAIIEGSKFARKIANTEPMKSIWEAETEPGPQVQTDAQFRQFAVNTVNSFYHPIGTCALLPKKDGGVVNANLIVYGTANLRVVDASVIPIQMSGHIQTAVYGIAEVAAQKIITAA